MKNNISYNVKQTGNSDLICENPINKLPILILLLNNKCNSKCQTCSYWIKEEKKKIQVEDIKHWISDWHNIGVQRIVLSGGEPLLHSEIIEICKTLADSGFDITLLTNGLLLDKYAHKIVKYCKDYVVSLNGPEHIHNEICNVNNAFKKLTEGINAIREYDKNTIITGRCTVQKKNFGYMRKVVVTALKLKLNRISFLAADITSSAFNRNMDFFNDKSITNIILTSDEINLLEEEILLLKKEYSEFFEYGYIAETPDLLRRKILTYYKAIINQCDFTQIECNAPWISAVIDFNADVLPCFFQRGMGNLYFEPCLSKIINSKKTVLWRESFFVQENKICQSCVCPLVLPISSA